jgi:hypothetical protein
MKEQTRKSKKAVASQNRDDIEEAVEEAIMERAKQKRLEDAEGVLQNCITRFDDSFEGRSLDNVECEQLYQKIAIRFGVSADHLRQYYWDLREQMGR